MCVAIYKKAGANAPALSDLKKCWDHNPDGAGMCFPVGDGSIEIHKGFMTWQEFENAFNVLRVDQMKDVPVFFHFRIATAGLVDGGNTHPFPVTGQRDALRLIDCKCKFAMIHNGMLPIQSSDGILSDTMELSLRIAKCHLLKDMRAAAGLLRDLIGSNKLAFMNAAGDVELVGDWIPDNEENPGVWYSNELWRQPAFTSYDNWFTGKSAYDDEEDYPDYEEYIIEKRDKDSMRAYKENCCPFCGSPTEKYGTGSKICDYCWTIFTPED